MDNLLIIGVDEVGRGCLAGPVAACAYVFHPGVERIPGLKDSKALTERQREALEEILLTSGRHGYGEASNAEVDELGINPANHLAMRRAVLALGIEDLRGYAIVVDGNRVPPLHDLNPGRLQCVIKADASVPAVSAASVLAKLRRDKFMVAAALQYPGYGFDSHVGYITPQHVQAVTTLGPCPLHRMSFAPLAPKKGKGAVKR